MCAPFYQSSYSSGLGQPFRLKNCLVYLMLSFCCCKCNSVRHCKSVPFWGLQMQCKFGAANSGAFWCCKCRLASWCCTCNVKMSLQMQSNFVIGNAGPVCHWQCNASLSLAMQCQFVIRNAVSVCHCQYRASLSLTVQC